MIREAEVTEPIHPITQGISSEKEAGGANSTGPS